jgi:hypothetical protein
VAKLATTKVLALHPQKLRSAMTFSRGAMDHSASHLERLFLVLTSAMPIHQPLEVA